MFILQESTCDFTICTYMCFYVNVHASVMYALWKLTAGGQRRRQFTAANMKEFSEGGREPVSRHDLQNQCPYKRINDKIRRKANIKK